ncbi:unknown protein [Waddlia chondrophila 2032/99]|uniref:Uncharacterized protein n=1 Tax=Waddlia chondrophila 2032/99 TaxID=765953 RepID=F8LBC9_9BACT|nr:unknown protein [Waddlia chondrophila 2032/99]
MLTACWEVDLATSKIFIHERYTLAFFGTIFPDLYQSCFKIKFSNEEAFGI